MPDARDEDRGPDPGPETETTRTPAERRWAAEAGARVSVEQQYTFDRKLGEGAFGEVWLATNSSGIKKAVKILFRSDDTAAELQSLQAVRALRHPYLLATEHFWLFGSRLHIVTELADGTLGGRLGECLDRGEPGVPTGELLGYIAEAADGLDFLHRNGVVHYDVKPANILTLNGHAKVADFGLVRAQGQTLASTSGRGTPAYMAPELHGGKGGRASDQYSLAVTYAHLRQGAVPSLFPTAPGAGPFADQFAGTLTPGELGVLRTALAWDPRDRYPTCAAFAAALTAALSDPRPPTGDLRRAAGPRGGPDGDSRSGVPDVSGTGPRAVRDRTAHRRVAAGALAAAGLGVGAWLVATAPRKPDPAEAGAKAAPAGPLPEAPMPRPVGGGATPPTPRPPGLEPPKPEPKESKKEAKPPEPTAVAPLRPGDRARVVLAGGSQVTTAVYADSTSKAKQLDVSALDAGTVVTVKRAERERVWIEWAAGGRSLSGWVEKGILIASE